MLKIFFAHPDLKITSLYQDYLTQNFMVDSAHDGLSAIRQIRLIRPDIIVSDYALPLLSGLGVLKYVRGNASLSPVPFIFLTDHPDASLALSFGANDWLERGRTSPAQLTDRIIYHLKINQPMFSS